MLIDLIRRNAATYGARPALRYGDECLSHSDLEELAARSANACEEGGIAAGERVVILLRNCPEFVAAFYGVTGMGATALLLDPGSRQHELAHACSECRPRGIITDAAGLERWREATDGLWDGGLELTVGAAGGTSEFAAALERQAPTRSWDTNPDRTATFQFSSGSTGRSKRIGRTHAQWAFETGAFIGAAGHTSDDVILCPVPLFHAYGLGCCLIAAAQAGAELVLQEHVQPFRLHREETLALARRWDATVLSAVPYMFELLASSPAGDLPAVRFCGSAGAPLVRETFEAFDRRFGIPIRQGYGSTEAGKVTLNVDDDPRPTWFSVGKPLPGNEVAVVDEDGRRLPAGEVGNVVIRSPGLTTDHEYPRAQESFAAGGFFLTGDVGRLDEEGRLTITGRTKLFVDVLGEKVDPGEVEEVLALHPAVHESVVVGIENGAAARTVLKAVVVPEASCDANELIRFCRDRLASYKVPALIEFREELPRSPIGKLLRKELL